MHDCMFVQAYISLACTYAIMAVFISIANAIHSSTLYGSTASTYVAIHSSSIGIIANFDP